MKIVVCIKQVPDLEDVSWSADNTINTGVEVVLNPFDEFAIEAALKIKDSTEDVQVIALSVGDLESKSILERAIAMGCDDAILISDEKDIYIHTLEEYTSMLLKKENESHFGTPFQWTFASGRKGKDIQLKCKIIK